MDPDLEIPSEEPSGSTLIQSRVQPPTAQKTIRQMFSRASIDDADAHIDRNATKVAPTTSSEASQLGAEDTSASARMTTDADACKLGVKDIKQRMLLSGKATECVPKSQTTHFDRRLCELHSAVTPL